MPMESVSPMLQGPDFLGAIEWAREGGVKPLEGGEVHLRGAKFVEAPWFAEPEVPD